MAALPALPTTPVDLTRMVSGELLAPPENELPAAANRSNSASRDVFNFQLSAGMSTETVEPDLARVAAPSATRKRKPAESLATEIRRTNNRISAQRSRARQKQRIADLEVRVSDLTKEVASLNKQLEEAGAREKQLLGRVTNLTEELGKLRYPLN